jgi:GAF domain
MSRREQDEHACVTRRAVLEAVRIACRPIVRPQGTRVDAETDGLAAVTQFMGRLAGCGDLDTLLATALEQLDALFGHAQSFVMIRDESGTRLYTVASHGFAESGVGSEVVIGEGLIGTAAARGIPLRTTNFARERVLSRAVREELTRIGDAGRLAREIPLPGLADAKSQLAIPLEARGEVLGVLCLQSDAAGRFLARDESHLQLLARHLALSMIAVGFAGGAEPAAAPASSSAPAAAEHAPGIATDGAGITVRYFPSDDSVFIDDAYLIKRCARAHLSEVVAVVPRAAPAGVHEQGNQARSKLEAARVPGQSRSAPDPPAAPTRGTHRRGPPGSCGPRPAAPIGRAACSAEVGGVERRCAR